MLFVLSVSLTGWYCVNKENKEIAVVRNKEVSFSLSFDSTLVVPFYAKYPKLILYKKQVVSMYQKNSYNFIWYDKKGRKETADVIYNKINNLFEDGVLSKVPYKETLDALFQKTSAKPDIDVELFLLNY